MEKIQQFIYNQSTYTKVIFAIIFILYIGYALNKTLNLLQSYGIGIFVARFLGTFIGTIFVPFMASVAVSLISYAITKKLLKKDHKFINHFSIVFATFSFLLFISLIKMI